MDVDGRRWTLMKLVCPVNDIGWTCAAQPPFDHKQVEAAYLGGVAMHKPRGCTFRHGAC